MKTTGCNLAHFKVPRYIEFVDEFPMTVTGKIQKFKMREQTMERRQAEAKPAQSGFYRGLLAGITLLLLSSPSCSFFAEGLTISLTQNQLQRIVNAVFPIETEQDALGVALSRPVVTLEEGADRIAFGLDISVSVVLEPGEGPAAQRARERADERAQQQAPEPEQLRAEERVARGRQKARAKAEDTRREARDRVGTRREEATANRDPELLRGTLVVSTGVRYAPSSGALFLDDVVIERLDFDQLPGRFNDLVIRLSSGVIGRVLRDRPIYELDASSTGGSIAGAMLRDIVVEDGTLKITVGGGGE